MRTQLPEVWLLNYLSNPPLPHFERGSMARWERERAWTVNPENSDSRITKMPAIANPTPPPPNDILHFLELIFRARVKDFEFDFSCPSKRGQTSAGPMIVTRNGLFDKSI